ncbi:hypothetical protein KIPB_009251, partial [Kipferlia bialata]|eukprot:g9251.t1
MPAHDVEVFVRIRPLVGEEVKRHDQELVFAVDGDKAQSVSFE